MRNKVLSLAILALLVLSGCQQSTESKDAAADEAMATVEADFKAKVDVLKELFTAHEKEDIASMAGLVADTLRFNPAGWNDNQWLGKEDFLAYIGGIHQNVDNLKFTPGVALPDTTAGAFFAGRNFPVQQSAPDQVGLIRAYGSWASTVVATGEARSIKWYGLFGLNEDNKVALISVYTDAVDPPAAEASTE